MFYFIFDLSFLDVFRIVCLLGIDVKIMILNKLDYVFVYWVILFYIGDFLKVGVLVYIYDNGFIYVKMIVVDDEMVLIGMVNIDVRSFRFNFEVNVFIYDVIIVKKFIFLFKEDLFVFRKYMYEEY